MVCPWYTHLSSVSPMTAHWIPVGVLYLSTSNWNRLSYLLAWPAVDMVWRLKWVLEWFPIQTLPDTDVPSQRHLSPQSLIHTLLTQMSPHWICGLAVAPSHLLPVAVYFSPARVVWCDPWASASDPVQPSVQWVTCFTLPGPSPEVAIFGNLETQSPDVLRDYYRKTPPAGQAEWSLWLTFNDWSIC